MARCPGSGHVPSVRPVQPLDGSPARTGVCSECHWTFPLLNGVLTDHDPPTDDERSDRIRHDLVTTPRTSWEGM